MKSLAFLALLSAFLALPGCSTTEKQAALVIDQGVILLANPKPGGPNWEKDRAKFLLNAKKWREAHGD